MQQTKTQYYLGEITENYGEHETHSRFVFELHSGESLKKKIKTLSSGHKCGKLDRADGRYWFDCYAHSPVAATRITEEEFNVLRLYIGRV